MEVPRRKVGVGQPWFSRELVRLRKEFHRMEREWLDCDDQGMRRQKRTEYVKIRKTYKVAVSKAKRKSIKFDIAHFVATKKLPFMKLKYPQICELESCHWVNL